MSKAQLAPLAGRGIVVTRPGHQAARLAELIAAAGGKVILFPTIEIVALEDQGPLHALIDRLDQFDMAIFVSPNAARLAMQEIGARRGLPPRLKLAAMGRGSTRELERHGAAHVIAPSRFDSEALLEMPEMREIAGQRVVIFRGEGGRELLAATLVARGATVEYAECYRRQRPRGDAGTLLRAWQNNELHAVTVSSSEGLRNLCEMAGASSRALLTATPLFVSHPRIEKNARELGFSRVVLSAQGDDGLVHELTRWFAAAQ